ncbi:hypothetical protein [Pedobacter arcticus]|uniref:hypothetical protein n=1 Tax=Pedobacter arcticus TaxID=752140 RepID=UPI000309F2D7|nr:hypothetical protein [Pedobacter arcticus]
MDNISTLFKNLNQRLSSPFFFSFLLAWCVFNWQIIIALLFYKHSEVKLDGYHSYIDLIQQNTSSTNNLWCPLLAAFAYTFIYPLFKNGIDAFLAWTKTWGENWNLRVSKSRKISINKYLQLREIYETRTTTLENILKKESLHLNENERLRNEMLDLSSKNNSLFRELSQWKAANDVNILNGEWFYNYRLKDAAGVIITKNYELIINGNQIDIIDNTKRSNIQLEGFYNDPNQNRITFTLKNEKGGYEHFELRKTDLNNLNLLKDTTNTGKTVELKRQRPVQENVELKD